MIRHYQNNNMLSTAGESLFTYKGPSLFPTNEKVCVYS